jgi:hypothetical protein
LRADHSGGAENQRQGHKKRPGARDSLSLQSTKGGGPKPCVATTVTHGSRLHH